jgi:hypothetical protein
VQENGEDEENFRGDFILNVRYEKFIIADAKAKTYQEVLRGPTPNLSTKKMITDGIIMSASPLALPFVPPRLEHERRNSVLVKKVLTLLQECIFPTEGPNATLEKMTSNPVYASFITEAYSRLPSTSMSAVLAGIQSRQPVRMRIELQALLDESTDELIMGSTLSKRIFNILRTSVNRALIKMGTPVRFKDADTKVVEYDLELEKMGIVFEMKTLTTSLIELMKGTAGDANNLNEREGGNNYGDEYDA